jgi:hypothetical protein
MGEHAEYERDVISDRCYFCEHPLVRGIMQFEARNNRYKNAQGEKLTAHGNCSNDQENCFISKICGSMPAPEIFQAHDIARFLEGGRVAAARSCAAAPSEPCLRLSPHTAQAQQKPGT